MAASMTPPAEFGREAAFELQFHPLTTRDLLLNLDLVERGPFAVAAELASELATLAMRPLESFASGTQREERLAPSILGGRRTRPVRLSLEMDRDRVVVESDELGLFATGASYDEAVDNLTEQLDLVARQYLNEDDSRLTPSGLRLKERLRRFTSE
jgi:predicted RNase H-like HicB family nuclease